MTQIQSTTTLSRLRNMFLSHSVRVRLMSLLGTLLLLTFLFCATTVVYFVYRTETTAWHGRQREAALAASQSVSTFVQHAEDTLTYLALLNPKSDLMILYDIIPMQPELLEVIRLDADGVVIASVHQDHAVLANLFTIPLSQWFMHAKAGKPFYGGVQISAGDEPYLILAVPSPDGGVVAARLHMEILWSVVADIRFGETGRAYVINQNGQVIAHTNPTVVLNITDIAGQPELATLTQSIQQEWSGEYVNFEGNAVVGVTAPIETTGWILITELAQTEAYTASRTALVVLGGGILLFMMLLLTLARSFLLRSVLHPIDRLRIGAERIGQGDLNYRIELEQPDEIGMVASAFNNMAYNLRERERQLADQAASLAAEVAERTKAEIALRQSETRYRAIVEDQTELICRFQDNGTLTFVNNAYCRYFGKTFEELVGHAFMPFIPVEDRQVVEDQYRSLSPENPMTSYEHRVLLKDGKIRWMQWTDRLILNGDGSVNEFQAVGRDITERRQVEEEIKLLNADLERRVVERTEQLASANRELQNEVAERERVEDDLRASKERLQIALRAARAGVWEWSMATNHAFWSEENYRVMGLEPGSVESHYDNWLHCVHPDDRQRASEAVTVAVEQRSDLNIEFRVVWPDGSIHWLNDIGRMIFDPRGQPIGMYGIQMDITERKQAENVLRESERRFREILESAQLASVMLDLQGNIIFCNKFLLSATGWKREEVIGCNWFDLFVPPETGIKVLFSEVVPQGTMPAYYENEIITRQGERLIMSWNNSYVRDTHGNITGTTSLGENITERKRAEAQVRASLHEKEILLKEIHHRVKNNLQIISSLLSLQSGSIDDPRVMDQFQDSQNRVRSMALIHERLYRSDNLAQIEFGTYLRELTASLVQTYRRPFGQTTLAVEADPVMLDIDTAIPCGLIVNELVSNALKHAFPNGRSGQIGVNIRHEENEQQVWLVVCDDGVGMPEDIDYRKTRSLGLQLVHSLTRQLGGTFELCEGSGTRFEIRFPAHKMGEKK